MVVDVLTCDRCRAITTGRGFTARHKDGRELQLCPVHEREHRAALALQKWEVTPNPPLVGPAARTGEKDQAYCACGRLVGSRLVQPNAESKMVRVTICPACDTRTCNTTLPGGTEDDPRKCGLVIVDPKRTECQNGHELMGKTA